MGDNVSFNVALARELGVSLGKCMAHAVNRTAMHGVLRMPGLFGVVVVVMADEGGGANMRYFALRWR